MSPDAQPPSERAVAALRLTVRVHPGARSAQVGGRYQDALVVRVREPAVDGRATAAALAAVANAFGVARRDVRLVSGATSRTKIVEVTGGDPAVLEALLRKLS